jgi:hypothetical protein
LKDAATNRRLATSLARFLVVRHARKNQRFYDALLHWLETHHPSIRARFELRHLPCSVRDWSQFALHIPWLQDPVQAWSPTAFRQANRLAAECDAHAISIINRVDRLSNAGKARGAKLIATAGIRTARMARINDPNLFRETGNGLQFPFFVREDWRHGGPLYRVDSSLELRNVPLRKFRRPVAVEFIDVQNPRDGLYRKYRYLAAGDVGFALSMHPCRSWFAKGSHTEFNDSLRDEEVAYLNQPDPNQDSFQKARRVLELDFVAFDYSYDRDGRLVVWEANPFPAIQFGTVHRQYRWPAVARAFAAMTRLYLTRAGLAAPPEIERYMRAFLLPAAAVA